MKLTGPKMGPPRKNGDGILSRLRNPTPATKLGAEILSKFLQDRFTRQEDPDGKPWKPLEEATIAARRGRGDARILQDTGILRLSITAKAGVELGKSPLSIVFGTLLLGKTNPKTGQTAAQYAAVHQFGSKTVDARPFLPADETGAKASPGTPAGKVFDRIRRVIGEYIRTGKLTGGDT